MSSTVVSVVNSPLERATAYELRRRVFVIEQGVPLHLERDERDDSADQVLAMLVDEPVGTGRLVVEPAGFEGLDPSLGPVGHLGRLAVVRAARGRGIGAQLVAAIEGLAAERELRCVYLGGQNHAVPFYERLGYRVYGQEFDDAGLPHRHMFKLISTPATHGGKSARSGNDRWLQALGSKVTESMTPVPTAQRSGSFQLGGDLPVVRLGFGAMQITGPGVWGPPADHQSAVQVLRRAVELGVTLIDTADAYGPYVSEDLIREALHPYDDVVIATKGGLTRPGPSTWKAVGRPEYLRQCVEMSLRRLAVDRIDLYQLHRIDAKVPLEDQIGELRALQDEGKIRHLGLSEVSVEELERVRALTPIVSVQNLYNLEDRSAESLVDYATAEGLGFIPWFPLATGALTKPGGALDAVVARTGLAPAQLALAWLLRRSPAMLPIPGTSSVRHLEENVAAAEVELEDEDFAALSRLAASKPH